MPGSSPALSALRFSLLASADTPLLVELVRECYGEDYAHGYFYDAGKLRQLIEAGMLYCAVATEAAGHIVAHMAVKLEYPGDHTADNFAGMMLPAYRGQGVLMQLGAVLLPVYESLGLLGLQTATVTHHAFSQKISSNTGTVTVGCLLADSPGSNADGLAIPHRMPILLQFYRLQGLPARAWQVPPCYRPLLRIICDALQWTVHLGDGDVCVPTVSVVEHQYDVRRGTMLLRFRSVGQDVVALLGQCLQDGANIAVQYIDVPLTDPAAPALLLAANARGWFFGGLMIGRGDTDFLRLQCCELPPADSRDGIVDAFSRYMVEQILRDRDRVQHG